MGNQNDTGPNEGAENLEYEIEISPELAEKFAVEAFEQLDVLENDLVDLDAGSNNEELLGEAFRAIHSFKGNAGFMGYGDLERLAHRMEDILDRLKSGVLASSPEIFTALLEGCDTLRNVVGALSESGGKVEGLEDKLQRLETCTSEASNAKQNQDAEQDEQGTETDELVAEESAEQPRVEDSPSEELRPETVINLDDDVPANHESAVEDLVGSDDEAQAESSSTDAVEDHNEVADAPAPVVKSPVPQASTTNSINQQYIRVEVEKLDSMLNQVGELISAAAAVVQHPELEGLELDQFQAAAGNLIRVTAGLHDASMAMRMIPIRGTYKKVARLVRDVSRKLGKKVDLQLLGEDTEVDKSVIDAISDPLVHLVRNALDHGIETPEQRLAAGKSETGTLTVRASHQGGEVWIEIEDNGGGINRDRILKSAFEKGLIQDFSAEFSDSEVFAMIFMPGFSTADQVTDISGRGVGMDVVKQNIESLRGRVEVTSKLGVGTKFTVRLPLTLAIIDAMIVRVSGAMYALPLLCVRESICVDEEALTTTPDQINMVQVREQMVPVLTLEQIYNSNADGRSLTDGVLVLVEDSGESYCLRVDELIGQRQIVIKALDEYISDMRGVSGCSVLGSGEICLILDVGALARSYQQLRAFGLLQPQLMMQSIEDSETQNWVANG